MLVASEFIDSIKYSKDDPTEYGINLDLIQKNYADQHNTDHGRIALVSNYVKISKELFPSINESIDNGLDKLNITRNDKISFYLMIPYLLWSSYALILNSSIFLYN